MHIKLDFQWSNQVKSVLIKSFKLSSFRDLQLETINVTLSKKDCIVIMPTGGGKSLCFQLPALIDNGVTIGIF
jgi:superfamily II DNA helicase RecQ